MKKRWQAWWQQIAAAASSLILAGLKRNRAVFCYVLINMGRARWALTSKSLQKQHICTLESQSVYCEFQMIWTFIREILWNVACESHRTTWQLHFPFSLLPFSPWTSSANINQVHLKTQISWLSESKNLCICIPIFFWLHLHTIFRLRVQTTQSTLHTSYS